MTWYLCVKGGHQIVSNVADYIFDRRPIWRIEKVGLFVCFQFWDFHTNEQKHALNRFKVKNCMETRKTNITFRGLMWSCVGTLLSFSSFQGGNNNIHNRNKYWNKNKCYYKRKSFIIKETTLELTTSATTIRNTAT